MSKKAQSTTFGPKAAAKLLVSLLPLAFSPGRSISSQTASRVYPNFFPVHPPMLSDSQGLDDSISLMSVSMHSHKGGGEAASGASMPQRQSLPLTPAPPQAPQESEDSSWEAKFAWGVYHSKVLVDVTETDDGNWIVDTLSGAAVPEELLLSERLLLAALEQSPENVRSARTADVALRMYYHAKWLAERTFAKGAESRYREAARLAKACRRSVLASHALSRLGYFLIFWNRRDEAREVLVESEALNSKSNALASFLLGSLERQMAGSDGKRLRAAEDRILSKGELPSRELEEQREELVKDITFWRGAELSPKRCTAASDVAASLICFIGHTFFGPR